MMEEEQWGKKNGGDSDDDRPSMERMREDEKENKGEETKIA